MDIRILGCSGSQIPGCNTTCFLLNENVLVDAGAVTSVLSLKEQQAIDYILVTHAHLDHVRDITFLADNLFYLEKDHPLVILSTSLIIDSLRTHLFNDVIWPDFSLIPNPENPILKFQVISPGEKVQLAGLDVTAIMVDHVVETVGYIVESNEGSVIFIGDTGPTREIWDVANNIANLKGLFIETSLPDSMKKIADVAGHLTPRGLEEQLNKLDVHNPEIYLFHIKLPYQESIQNEVASIKNRKIHLLSDGEIIRIGPS